MDDKHYYKKRGKQTAEILFQQLKCDKNALMCWASRDFTVIPASDKHYGGLQFTVSNNPKIRVTLFIKITLNAWDTYDIKFIQKYDTDKLARWIKFNNPIIKDIEKKGFDEALTVETRDGVYCDMLHDVIFEVLG